ncbi:uncharacterized protein LOC114311942 [Camellia sinensis]|uniref:uncharacterized protein LOC114311942 n=1 Tax=Camellia sinensis TaxID=4442 RepID=UPI0010361E7A|nr:uncharacterized protein LOC114311942 [Camellia sinensis]
MSSNEELVRLKDEADVKISDLQKELEGERVKALEERESLQKELEAERAKVTIERETLKKELEAEKAKATAERASLENDCGIIFPVFSISYFLSYFLHDTFSLFLVGTSKGKRGRGKSRSLKLAKLKNQGVRLPIQICKVSGRPYGEASEKFTSELGIVTRQFAPQNVPSWTDISEEDKETLVAYLQEGFKFTNEPYAIESILNLMHDRYKSYRHDLRKRFRSFHTMESALADPPENMEKEAWKFLCEKWSDKDYKGSCFVVFQKYGGMLEPLLILYEVWPECTDVPKTKFQIKVLQACVDLKLRSYLPDFECHFNEAIEKKMR